MEQEKILKEFISEIKKYGLKKASRKSGVSYMTIVSWCNGKNIPTLINAQKVADAMGLEFLLFEKE